MNQTKSGQAFPTFLALGNINSMQTNQKPLYQNPITPPTSLFRFLSINSVITPPSSCFVSSESVRQRQTTRARCKNMEPSTSTILGRPSFKETKGAPTSIEAIPRELLSEVLARVAAESFTDIFNAKLSCKIFQEAAEDAHVYRRVSLDNFPLIAWKPLSEKQQSFLTKCEECQNPEMVYRRAVIGYFTGKLKLESALKSLETAINLKHLGALYASCILLLYSGKGELIEKGAKLLGSMNKSKYTRREVKLHRDKLKKMMREIWVQNQVLGHRPRCCTREDNHKRQKGWAESFDTDEEEDVHCEACRVDSELSFF